MTPCIAECDGWHYNNVRTRLQSKMGDTVDTGDLKDRVGKVLLQGKKDEVSHLIKQVGE